jgi:1-acyl-sn-glycerol-3-phosphate acyltransferase
LPLLILHMLIGLPLALLSFTRAGKSIQVGATSLNEWMIRWWSRWVCWTFGVRIRPGSTLPAPPMLIVANHSSWLEPMLIVANHSSWLDILVLSSLGHLHFVSKAEIARWPLIGTVAKVAGVIFHSRGSSDSLTDAADAVKKALQSGGYAAIFPEGGVNDAISVNRFHARLFKAAIESGSPVQPVCIRYTRHGAINVETSFRGQESTSRNMLRLLIAPGCEAVLSILPVVLPGEKSRRQIAEEAQALVSNEYGSDCD